MFSLSLREQVLVTAVILAVVLGVSVKHWRDTNRETAAVPPVSAKSATASNFPSVAHAQGRPSRP